MIEVESQRTKRRLKMMWERKDNKKCMEGGLNRKDFL